jgi:hypothetical protein
VSNVHELLAANARVHHTATITPEMLREVLGLPADAVFVHTGGVPGHIEVSWTADTNAASSTPSPRRARRRTEPQPEPAPEPAPAEPQPAPEPLVLVEPAADAPPAPLPEPATDSDDIPF